MPLWLLPLDLPAWGVMAALFTAMLFTPLVNGPTIGVITARTPVDLRPKMMTALISISTLSAPAGFLVAGQLLEPWGVERVFAAVAIGMTDGGARVRRDRTPAPRRGGAGSHRDRGLGGLGEIAAQPLLRQTLLLGRREPRPEVREHAADGRGGWPSRRSRSRRRRRPCRPAASRSSVICAVSPGPKRSGISASTIVPGRRRRRRPVDLDPVAAELLAEGGAVAEAGPRPEPGCGRGRADDERPLELPVVVAAVLDADERRLGPPKVAPEPRSPQRPAAGAAPARRSCSPRGRRGCRRGRGSSASGRTRAG